MDTSIAVTAECASGPDVTLHWAITAGECGIRPGAIELAGEIGVDAMPTVLGPGAYCVWALAVDAECRVVAGTSTGLTLPDERGTVTLELDEESCVSPEEGLGWDLLVSASASCTPSCEPSRCRCNGASSCEGDVGYCPAPLSGQLLEASETHTCVARRGGSEVHCWGGGLPVSMVAPNPIQELAVGTDFVCVLGPTGSSSPSSISCRHMEEGEPWQPVDRSSDCAGETVPNLVVRDMEAAGQRVCAVAENTSGSGIACWGAPIAGTLGTRMDDCTTTAMDVLRGPRIFRLPDGLRWRDLAVGTTSVCAVRGTGEVDCAGAGAPDPSLLPAPDPGASFELLEMAGNSLCARASNGQVQCTDVVPEQDGWVDFDFAYLDGEATFCGRRPNGRLKCLGQPPFETRYSTMVVAPGSVCLATTDGAGGVACFPVGGDEPVPGTQAATDGERWVCPDA